MSRERKPLKQLVGVTAPAGYDLGCALCAKPLGLTFHVYETGQLTHTGCRLTGRAPWAVQRLEEGRASDPPREKDEPPDSA